MEKSKLVKIVKTNQENIDLFTKGTGDYNPVHNQSEFKRLNLSKKTPFKKPIVPGMYELLLIDLFSEEINHMPIAHIDANFVRPINIGDDITIKVKGEAPYTKFELYKPRSGKEKLCLECKTSLDEEFKIENHKLNSFTNEKNLNLSDLNITMKSVGVEFFKFIPRMFYASSLLSETLLKAEKPKEEGFAAYRNLRINFYGSIQEQLLGKHYVCSTTPEGIKQKRGPSLYRYQMKALDSKNNMILRAAADISIV